MPEYCRIDVAKAGLDPYLTGAHQRLGGRPEAVLQFVGGWKALTCQGVSGPTSSCMKAVFLNSSSLSLYRGMTRVVSSTQSLRICKSLWNRGRPAPWRRRPSGKKGGQALEIDVRRIQIGPYRLKGPCLDIAVRDKLLRMPHHGRASRCRSILVEHGRLRIGVGDARASLAASLTDHLLGSWITGDPAPSRGSWEISCSGSGGSGSCTHRGDGKGRRAGEEM